MPESTSLVPSAGGGAADPYRASNRRSFQEVTSSQNEIIRFEQVVSEARTPTEYYREFKHLVLYMLRFALSIRPQSTQRIEWEGDPEDPKNKPGDRAMLDKVAAAVQADYVPPRPTIRTECHAHSNPILYDLYVADFPMLSVDRGALPLMLGELKEAFVARETERGIARMGAAYLFVGKILSKYRIWDIDTKIRSTAEGWDPSRAKAEISEERDYMSMEAEASGSTARSGSNDRKDNNDDDPSNRP